MDPVIDEFHKLYYNSEKRTWRNTFFLGTPAQKCPLDLWVYQEIMWELRPDLILECGTAGGGSALYLASMCDLIGCGKVISIDINHEYGRPIHPRITYLLGSSVDDEIVSKVRYEAAGNKTVLVILDSDHTKDHVLKELETYSKFVSPNSYIIVEDTNINGNPVYDDFGPGPMEAVDEFLTKNANFIVDIEREKFFMTFNPKGYLKRTA
jgi:cephalosporin hydroxylase